jgi:hypothetical protein
VLINGIVYYGLLSIPIQEFIMRIVSAFLLAIIISVHGHSSGSIKIVALDDCVYPSSGVYTVRILDSDIASVKELEPFGNEVAHHPVYIARIVKILNPGFRTTQESCHIVIPERLKSILKKNKNASSERMTVNDHILIMDRENISYSMIYHVENRHKIFYYYQCDAEVKQVAVGKEYIFITDEGMSDKNGVMYGNIRFGLYPDTELIRQKIMSIINRKGN